jgi:hypothetical protein
MPTVAYYIPLSNYTHALQMLELITHDDEVSKLSPVCSVSQCAAEHISMSVSQLPLLCSHQSGTAATNRLVVADAQAGVAHCYRLQQGKNQANKPLKAGQLTPSACYSRRLSLQGVW